MSTDYLCEIRFDAKVGSQLFESEAQPATKKAWKSDLRTAENRLKGRLLVFRSGLKGYCYTSFEWLACSFYRSPKGNRTVVVCLIADFDALFL